MKRFISALTAFCMCASMTVSSLPASALKLTDTSAITAKAGEHTWSFTDTVYTPGTDQYAVIKAVVSGDPGTYGYEFTPLIDGKSFKDAGFKLANVEQSEDGYEFGSFKYNDQTGKIAAANTAKSDISLPDGTAVLELYIVPPANAAPGTEYTVSFSNLIVGNEAEVKTTPASKSGKIKIAGSGQTDPTPAPDTKPDTQPDTQPKTDATETPTSAPETKPTPTGWTWSFEDVTYNPAKDTKKAGVPVNVYVTKDQGTYGYQFTPLVDGKSLADAGFKITTAEQTEDGYEFGTFTFNEETGKIGGSNSEKSNVTVPDGQSVITMYLLPPANAKAGTKYKLTFDGLLVGDFAENRYNPATQAGSITIVGDEQETTQAATRETEKVETQAQTDPPETQKETSSKPDDTPTMDEKKNSKDWTWYGEDVIYDPAKDTKKAGVPVNIYVTKDPGTYGYQFTPTIDGKSLADAGFKITTAEQVEDGYEFGTFTFNEDSGKTGGSNAQKQDVTVPDGTAVVTLYLLPPDNAPAGKVYKVNIDGLLVGNFKEEKFHPATIDGSITIKGAEQITTDATEATEATKAPTEATKAPTDATEATKAPTEATKAPTEATKAPTEATKAPTEATKAPTEAPTQKTTDEVKAPVEVDMVWDIEDVTCYAGDTVEVPVVVKGNVGFNSFTVQIKADDGPVASDATSGNLAGLTKVYSNAKQLMFGSTDTATGKDVKGDGNVFILNFKVPDNAAEGTIYNLDFADLKIYNLDMVPLIPKKNAGSIKIIAKDKPQDETKFVEETKNVDAEWKIGETVVEPGAVVKLPVTVSGDTTGLNSYIAKITADSALKVNGAEAGTAYNGTKFEKNTNSLNEMYFGGTSVDKKDVVPAGGTGDVFYIEFVVPADAEDGAIYPVEWSDLTINSGDMERLVPKKSNGFIKIKKIDPKDDTTEEATPVPQTDSTEGSTAQPESETKPTTEESTNGSTEKPEPSTEESTNGTTEAPEPTTQEATEDTDIYGPTEKKIEKIDAEWIIGTTEVDPGAVVDLPITVKGDKGGLNSYIAGIKVDAGPTVTGADAGEAYERMHFEKNIAELLFAGTTTGKDAAAAADNSEVFHVTFEVPKDAVPGTKYNVVWARLDIENGEMVTLVPVKVDGWIKIKEVPTEETPTATESDTETDTKQPVTDTDTETDTKEPDTETDTQQPDTETDTQQPDTETDTQQPDTETDTKEPVTETDTKEPVTETDTKEPVTDIPTETDTKEPVTETDTKEPVTETDTKEPVTETDTKEPVTETDTKEPVTETDTKEPVTETDTKEPVTETDTKEPVTETDTKEPVTETKPVDPGQNSKDSKMIWEISDEKVTAKADEKVKVNVLVSVEGDEVGLNSYITKMKVAAANDKNSAALPVAVDAIEGKAYEPFTFKANPAEMMFAATYDANANLVASGNDVFEMVFEIPLAGEITYDQVDASGARYALFNVVWDGNPQLVNAGSTTESAFTVNPAATIDGSIRVYAPDEYKYELNGKDVFCFAHDPRPFTEVFASAKLYRRVKDTDDWEEITGKVTDFQVTIADGAYETPIDAYMALGKDACYKGIALKATFKDSGKEVTLDSASGFNSKAYIGVKGDTNLDGICNSKDGTAILTFAAAFGTGRVDGTAYDDANRAHLAGQTGVAEILSFFLSDIDGEHTTFGLENSAEEIINVDDVINKFMAKAIENGDTTEPRTRTSYLNSADAVSIFRYAAKVGTNAKAGEDGHKSMPEIWNDVFGDAELPKYSKEIADYIKANPDVLKKQSDLDAKIMGTDKG